MKRNKSLATQVLSIANWWQLLLCENVNNLLMDPQARMRAEALKCLTVNCLENSKLTTSMF